MQILEAVDSSDKKINKHDLHAAYQGTRPCEVDSVFQTTCCVFGKMLTVLFSDKCDQIWPNFQSLAIV